MWRRRVGWMKRGMGRKGRGVRLARCGVAWTGWELWLTRQGLRWTGQWLWTTGEMEQAML